ncbi:MAG: aldo/keto reductase [Candidatus Latescibacteria bacterium]|nr:aldo/keto reductase [Candidatus Latescibacterota bacterium]
MSSSNRRNFLKNLGSAPVAAGLASACQGSRRTLKKDPTGKYDVAYRKLGSTGYKVSELGFGAMNTRDEELVQAAIDSGINYIDTAHGYMKGENERIVGNVLKRNNNRDKVFLATKVYFKNKTSDELRGMMELSLKRLQVDHVDTMFMHMPDESETVFDEKWIKTFDKARKDGLCRYVGVSIHTNHADLINACVDSNFWEFVLVGYNYHSPTDVTAAIERARKAGLAIVAMKTQKRCKEKGYPNHNAEVTDNQAALKWVLQNPNIDTTIPGMTAFEQLTEDLAVMGMKMTIADRLSLNSYSQNNSVSSCRGVSGCTGCLKKCPKGVEICEINRCLGYAYGYDDIELAHENYAMLPTERRIDVCDDCEKCKVKCVNGLDLTRSVRLARELFV